ncbi:MAG: fibronectin type III domain-containing protein [Thermoplasmata archaeon]|nr:fibronectin type III domain-containing protein [Thermoplasmata archaeon]MCI4359512.1 fibronectin type III domain-containing protein [Thermoplasmata archaeon]
MSDLAKEGAALGVCLAILLAMTWVGSGPVQPSTPSGKGNASIRTMATSVPPGMALSTVCWSPYDKEYVAFGGYNSTSSSPSGSQAFYRNWTYTYQGGTWTNLTSSSGFKMPNGGPSDACFYNPPSHSIIFLVEPFVTVSGLSQTQTYTEFTYSFQGGEWSNISATAHALPPEGACWAGLPELGAAAWDPLDGYGFYYAACPNPGGKQSFVPVDWEFSGGVWSNITRSVKGHNPTEIATLTWDNQTQHIILVSGWNTTSGVTTATKDYWMYSNETWTRGNFANMPASGFTFSPYVGYNPTDNYLIVAGGIGGTATQETGIDSNYESVYELNGTVWSNITASSSAPSSRAWTSTGTANNTADLMFGLCPLALTNCEPFYSSAKGQAQFFTGGSWSMNPAGHCVGNDCTGLPSAPTGLTVPTENYTSVTLRWTNPGYWLWNYTVYYAAGPNCTGPMSAIGTHSAGTTATVTGLSPGTQYAFDLTAWNGTGQSSPSSCLVRTTGLFPSAPTYLEVTQTGLTTVSLNWTNPGGGGLVNDTVYWTNGSGCDATMSAVSLGGVGTSYAVSGLTAGTAYSFTVTAWNSTWQSPPATCLHQTTAQTPAAPTGLHITAFTKTSITLSWTNPPGGGIVNDTVYYRVGSSCSGPMKAAGTSGLVTSSTISGLTPGTAYAMDVAAWNVTQSPVSGCVVKTTAQIATTPANLAVLSFGTSYVLLSWTESEKGLLNLTLYRAHGDSCTGLTKAYSVGTGALSGYPSYQYNATGMATGTTYAFDVTAWNSTGQSVPSNCVTQTTAQVPAAPTRLDVASANGSSISVSWTNPGGGGLVSTTLYFEAGTNCSGTMTAKSIYGARETATLTGLSPGTEYALAVTAWNATGQSQKSTCVTATTSFAPSGSTGSFSSTLPLELGGVATAALVIALAALLLWRRRKRGPAEPPTSPSGSNGEETLPRVDDRPF